jgi:Iap family predicted aminopeptidase
LLWLFPGASALDPIGTSFDLDNDGAFNDGEFLTEQPVQGVKEPNIICTLPGADEKTIIVGAHFDYSDKGYGVVDNWSGASLLPSLYASTHSVKRNYTFKFIGFSGEEKGLIGSREYVKKLKPEEVAQISAMVNLDTLGLGPAEVWVSKSDPMLVQAIANVAGSLKLLVNGMNVDEVGDSDGSSFGMLKIPVITIHSLTSATLIVLHTGMDRLAAIRQKDYYESYKLISAYLAYLDVSLGEK